MRKTLWDGGYSGGGRVRNLQQGVPDIYVGLGHVWVVCLGGGEKISVKVTRRRISRVIKCRVGKAT